MGRGSTLRPYAAPAPPSAKGASTTIVKPRRTPRDYLFRGLLFCALCQRRMPGQWLREMAYYRCRFPDQYAMANHLAHPRNVYLREDQITPPLDDWLLTALAPDHLEATVEAMYASQPSDMIETPVDLAQQTITECDRKVANYRALLDAGTDPSMVAGWIAETTALRATAQAQQRSRQAPHRQARLTKPQIRRLITAVDDLRAAIRRAEAKPAKTALYQQLRVRLTYDSGENSVRAEADLGPDAVGNGFVSEDRLQPYAHAVRSTAWTTWIELADDANEHCVRAAPRRSTLTADRPRSRPGRDRREDHKRPR